jgi:hypothetical protein
MHPSLTKYMLPHIVINHRLSIPHLWFVASPCHVQMFINLVVLTHTTQNNNSNFINQKVHWEIKTTIFFLSKTQSKSKHEKNVQTKQTTNQKLKKLKVNFY